MTAVWHGFLKKNLYPGDLDSLLVFDDFSPPRPNLAWLCNSCSPWLKQKRPRDMHRGPGVGNGAFSFSLISANNIERYRPGFLALSLKSEGTERD